MYKTDLAYYRHSDWLGSSRFASTPARAMYYDGAYGPFGELYAQTGTTDVSFTGMNQDSVANLYDFPAREYGTQGRWPSPDPSGLSSVHLRDPQTLNRYAYARNNPLNLPIRPACTSTIGRMMVVTETAEVEAAVEMMVGLTTEAAAEVTTVAAAALTVAATTAAIRATQAAPTRAIHLTRRTAAALQAISHAILLGQRLSRPMGRIMRLSFWRSSKYRCREWRRLGRRSLRVHQLGWHL